MRQYLTMIIVAVAVIVLNTGCELLTGPDTRRVMGRISEEGVGYVPLEAPDTVTAGTPFEVVVRTVGGSTCWRSDGQEIKSASGVLEVTPYDRVTVGVMCGDAIVFPERTLEVVFDQPGEAVLRLRGRMGGESVQDGRVGTIDFSVHVR